MHLPKRNHGAEKPFPAKPKFSARNRLIGSSPYNPPPKMKEQEISVIYSSASLPFTPPLVFPYQWQRRRLRRLRWFWDVELELRSDTPTPSSKTRMAGIATMFTARDVGLVILDQSFCCATSATRDIIFFALDPFLFRCPRALGSVPLAPTSRNPNVWFLFPQSMVFFFRVLMMVPKFECIETYQSCIWVFS